MKTVDLYTQSAYTDLNTESIYTSLNSDAHLKFGLKANLLDSDKPSDDTTELTDRSL